MTVILAKNWGMCCQPVEVLVAQNLSGKIKMCCNQLLDYFCCLKTDFIRIHGTWGVLINMLGSTGYHDIFRV